jgi:hypothetical protein
LSKILVRFGCFAEGAVYAFGEAVPYDSPPKTDSF